MDTEAELQSVFERAKQIFTLDVHNLSLLLKGGGVLGLPLGQVLCMLRKTRGLGSRLLSCQEGAAWKELGKGGELGSEKEDGRGGEDWEVHQV